MDFLGNQKPPNFEGNYSLFRFNGGVYPTEDAAYELGNGSARWSLVRGVTVVSGDTILSDKTTGKELYKIHEDDDFIYFSDIRTGKVMMRLGVDGNLYVTGRVVENAASKAAVKNKTIAQKRIIPAARKKRQTSRK